MAPAQDPLLVTEFGVSGSVQSVEGETRFSEEAVEDAVPVLQRLEPSAEERLQLSERPGGQVPLDMRPQALHRIQLGRVPTALR